MSSSFVSRAGWRQCRIRRLYSTEPPDKPKAQAQRAPRASNFEGIEIGPTPKHLKGMKLNRRYIIPLFSPNTSAVSASEFRPGLSKRLAEKKVADRMTEDTANNMANAPWIDMVAGPEQKQQQAERAQGGEKAAGPSSQRRPPAQADYPDELARNQPQQPRADRQPRPPAQSKPDLMHTRHRGAGSSSQRRQRRPRTQAEEEDLDFDESDADDIYSDDAYATPIRMRRPDPTLAPPRPALPPPLTTLEIQFDVDHNLQGLHERQGGDYARHFSPEVWSLARAQSMGPLVATDYARLALGLNRSVRVEEKRVGMQMVKKLVDKSAGAATAP